MITPGDYITAHTPTREDQPWEPPTEGTVEAIHQNPLYKNCQWLKLVGVERMIPIDRVITVNRQSAAKAA